VRHEKGVGDMYGSRQKLWDMSFLYQEIMDFATIFNVEDRGKALIADFKNVKMICVLSSARTKRPLVCLLVLQLIAVC
jgi:hypothetical protein